MEELMPIIFSLLEMFSSTTPALSGEGTENKPDYKEKENEVELEEELINSIMSYVINSSDQLKMNELDIVLIFIIIIILSSDSQLNDIDMLKFLPFLFSIMEEC